MTSYPEIFRIRSESGISRAVAIAARHAGVSAAEWSRRAIRAALIGQGVAAPTLPLANENSALSGLTRDPDLRRHAGVEFCRRTPAGSFEWAKG